MTDEPTPPASGDALGANHRLQRRLGCGASGEVWQVLDRRDGRQVAGKLLRPELDSAPRVVSGFLGGGRLMG